MFRTIALVAAAMAAMSAVPRFERPAAAASPEGDEPLLRQLTVPGLAPTHDVVLREAVGPSIDIEVADLDGDGLSEVVFAGIIPSIASTDGHRFGRPVAIEAAVHPAAAEWRSVALVDFEGDGDLDVLLADEFGRVASIRTDGRGSYSLVEVRQLGAAPGMGSVPQIVVAPAVGDVSRMVLVPSIDGTIGVELAADGGFGAEAVVSEPRSRQLGLVDGNGDGIDDLVATGIGAVHLAVRRADGTWEPAVEIADASGLASLDIGDLDGDGHDDVAIASAFGDQRFEVLMNDPAGLFEPSMSVGDRLCDDGQFIWLEILDANQDGSLDLLSVAGSCMVLELGDGRGGFTPGPDRPTPLSTGPAVAADLDGDGRLELVLGQSGARTAFILRDLVGPVIGDVVTFELVGGIALPIPFDIDPDAANGTELVTLDRALPPAVSQVVVYSTEVRDRPQVLTSIEVNGRMDLQFDVVGPTASEPTLVASIVEFDGVTSVDIHSIQDQILALEERIEVPANTRQVRLADMDGDGRRDLVLGVSWPPALQVIRRTTEGPVVAFTRPDPFGEAGLLRFAVGEIDGDGRPDVAAVTVLLDDHRLWFVRGVGDGTLGAAEPVPGVDATIYTFDWAFVDWTGDGQLDVVGPDPNGAGIQVASIPGPGRPATVTSLIPAGSTVPLGRLSGADVDGDGDPDLVGWAGPQFDRDLDIIENRMAEGLPPRRFTTWVGDTVNPVVSAAPGVADLDGDGHADLYGLVYQLEASVRRWGLRFGGPGPVDCSADLNLDGTVGFHDLLALLSDFAVPSEIRFVRTADLDEDGDVGMSDLTALIAAWGDCDGR